MYFLTVRTLKPVCFLEVNILTDHSKLISCYWSSTVLVDEKVFGSQSCSSHCRCRNQWHHQVIAADFSFSGNDKKLFCDHNFVVIPIWIQLVTLELEIRWHAQWCWIFFYLISWWFSLSENSEKIIRF